MTTTTEASEALARLREVVKPGDWLVVMTAGFTRSGIRKVAVCTALTSPWEVTETVAEALGATFVRNTRYIGLRPDESPSLFIDRLSVALFGEPGQIQGEYL